MFRFLSTKYKISPRKSIGYMTQKYWIHGSKITKNNFLKSNLSYFFPLGVPIISYYYLIDQPQLFVSIYKIFRGIGDNLQNYLQKPNWCIPILLRGLILYFLDKNRYNAYFSISFSCNVSSTIGYIPTKLISGQISHSNVRYE